VEKVVVALAEDRARIVDNRAMPDICLQHLVAVMLLDRCVTPRSSHDFKRMHDSRVLRLRKRIELIGSPELADPQRRWHARVEIRLQNGRVLKHYTHAARGYFLNPMTREEESEKSLDLLAPVIGKKRAQTLVATIWDVEKLKDARTLGMICRPP
jgi:2-methylcitrate dehydratase PrpD